MTRGEIFEIRVLEYSFENCLYELKDKKFNHFRIKYCLQNSFKAKLFLTYCIIRKPIKNYIVLHHFQVNFQTLESQKLRPRSSSPN